MMPPSKWLSWEPPPKTNGKRADDSLTELTESNCVSSVSATPGQIANFSLEAEPAAYEEAFDRWLLEHCVFRDRARFGLGALHRDYFLWCEQKGQEVPASRGTFRLLLAQAGFQITEDDLVRGLMPAKDLPFFIKT